MINALTEPPVVGRVLVPERHRSVTVAELFGDRYSLQFEPYLYALAGALSPDYCGAFWNFFALSNGGFYQTPDEDRPFGCRCENGYEGNMSADTFGITCCLYTYSHLSFAANGEAARVYARQYHLLRAFMFEHAEAPEILHAID